MTSGDEGGSASAPGDHGAGLQALKEPEDVEAASKTSQVDIGGDSQSTIATGEERQVESERTKDWATAVEEQV